MRSYKDCHTENGHDERDLHFLSSQTLSPFEARKVLSEAIPNGYNYFEASTVSDLAQEFEEEPEIIVGREYSVVLYIIGECENFEGNYGDEYHKFSSEEFIERFENRENTELSDLVKAKVRYADTVHRFWWD